MNHLVKYQRTPHLPWSPGASDDDVRADDLSHFDGREVVVTEKMDGENTSLYCNHMHARSLDSQHHPSRDWVKALHGGIKNDIPEGWRLCGENLYARHSIAYLELRSYFYLFSVWDDENNALSWDQTIDWANLLDIVTVPVLYRGPWETSLIRDLAIDPGSQEGYVVRVADAFSYDEFQDSLAKWVRPAHVQTDQHWMHAEIVPNQLASEREPSS